MGPQLKVSSERLANSGIEPATPGLQGKWHIHYTTAAPKKTKDVVLKLANESKLCHKSLFPSLYRKTVVQCFNCGNLSLR